MVDSMIRMTTRKQNRVSDKRQARAAGPGCSAPQWELEVRTCFPLAPLRVMHMAVNIDQAIEDGRRVRTYVHGRRCGRAHRATALWQWRTLVPRAVGRRAAAPPRLSGGPLPAAAGGALGPGTPTERLPGSDRLRVIRQLRPRAWAKLARRRARQGLQAAHAAAYHVSAMPRSVPHAPAATVTVTVALG